MGCHTPLPAYRSLGGAVSLREPLTDNYEYLRLPCGHCIGCRQSRAREWAFRCTLELKTHAQACWVTLTYDQDHVPYTLSKDHFAGYLKRLRSRIPARGIRFFGCGEYGEQNGRPHFHIILFGLNRNERAIREAWSFGHLRVDPLTPAAISYVAGYTQKKAGRPSRTPEEFEIVDDFGEVHRIRYQAPFTQMSRNPGIGSDARKHHRSWREKAVYEGLEIPVPRYLHNAWIKNTSPEEHQLLKTQNQNKPRYVHDRASLQAMAAHALAKQNLRAQKRPL